MKKSFFTALFLFIAAAFLWCNSVESIEYNPSLPSITSETSSHHDFYNRSNSSSIKTTLKTQNPDKTFFAESSFENLFNHQYTPDYVSLNQNFQNIKQTKYKNAPRAP